jgi:hypothetical protein
LIDWRVIGFLSGQSVSFSDLTLRDPLRMGFLPTTSPRRSASAVLAAHEYDELPWLNASMLTLLQVSGEDGFTSRTTSMPRGGGC